MRYCLLILLLLPALCFAQINITGRVINVADNKPVTNASVFLSNATIGDKTNDQGVFVLRNVRAGQYEFVVSIIGFETYRETVMVNAGDLTLKDIKLSPKTTELKEIRIVPGHDASVDIANFTREFLGESELAKQCRILNPEMLNLDYDSEKRTLTGTSYDFLLVENKALGYNIKYLLTKFVKDNKIQFLYFEGSAFFTDMEGTPSQKKRWLKRRQEVYLGSSMHFLRALIGNTVDADGFRVMRLIRKPNPKYVNGIEPKYIQTLVNQPLPPNDYVKRTDKSGLFALTYKDCLYVVYTKKKNMLQEFSGVNKVSYKSSYFNTIVTIDADFGLFDSNGVFTNPESVIFEGNWGLSRMAELLPVDYVPPVK